MPNSDIPEECDVLVIGAGMGGLTSAAALAKAGLRVCVVDMQWRPGGYLAGFQRKANVYDTAIHWLNQCGPNGFVRRMFDMLGPNAPETAPLQRIRRYKSDSFDYLLTNTPDTLRDQWCEEFSEDAAGIRQFFAAAKRVGQVIDEFSWRARTRETMGLFEKAIHGLDLLKTGLPFMRYLGTPTERGLRKFFKNKDLQRVFCSEENLVSCLVPIGWAYYGDYQIPPKGGSQEFANWLCGVLAAYGATVAYGCRVTEILMDGKHACGVRLVQGRHRQTVREIRSKYIVAACDVESVYTKMLPKGLVQRKVLDKLSKAELYDSSVTVSVGLNTHPRNLGFDEELVFVTRGDLGRGEHNSGDPHKAGISVLAPSLRDPSLAPEGKGTLTLYVSANIKYGNFWHTEYGLKRGPDYKAFKKSYADVLLQRVQATVAPELLNHIEHYDVATPITHLRYTGNRDGTIMAQQPRPQNIRAGVARYSSPVANLFIGGHWAEYGGGVPIAVRAGMNSALLILQRENPAAFEAMRDVIDGRAAPTDVRLLPLLAK